MEFEKKRILISLLGNPKEMPKGDLLFYCPFCRHRKKKLVVNIGLGQYNCWTCNTKGRSLYPLLKKLNVTDKNIYDTFKTDKNNVFLRQTDETPHSLNKELLTLPKEFKPLYLTSGDPEYKHALRYIIKRKLTSRDILKYNIGYCDSGPYRGMIIIPSYDINGQLNFFAGRSYYENATRKHKLPKISKDVIGFEMFINWKLPLILVEGPLDAIAIKRNVIPLFGKKILPKLKEKILLEKVKELYICLDNDAKKDSLKLSEYFLNYGVTVYFVNLKDKDPNDIGFINIHDILKTTKTFDFEEMIKLKLAI